MDLEERNPYTMLGFTRASPPLGAKDEEDEAAFSKGSLSEEREGTTWGGDAGVVVGGGAADATR